MNAYIYCADIYCQKCGEAIKAKLDAEGQTPANPDDERTFDSDEYPKGPFSDGGGEADTPQHCGECHVPLENDLTSDGVKYVIDALKEHTENGRGDNDVLKGWAEQLSAYSLNDEQQSVLDKFNGVEPDEEEDEEEDEEDEDTGHRVCVKCGEVIGDEDDECPHCGADQDIDEEEV